MDQQEQVLMGKYTLKIKNQKMENDYQLMEKKLQRKALFPIILLYQLGFLINYITKIINGISILGIFVDASTNISLFFLILTMKVKRFKRFSHISFCVMCIIMTIATAVNYIHDQGEASSTDEKKGVGFNGFYLGATLFGIIIGPSFSYRIALMLLFSSLYAFYIIYEPANQRPLSGFIVISHFTLYFYKIYQEEKQKRKFYISTQKVNFWESIIQNVLLINLMVVKYDKEQQRLVLEKSNKTAMGNIKVKSNEDLQQFLEQTKIKIQNEKTQEDSYSMLLEQDTSATRLTKISRDRKSKLLSHSKTVVGGEKVKFNTTRGSSNSSYITLKELVKEKLHQKQLISKQRGSSAFGLSDQSIQSFNGQYQYNQNGDIHSFNLKVICFGMIEDYALICVEDETYKEKFSNQFQKNSFLLNILGDVMLSQKQEIQNIHKQLDQGIQSISSYFKSLQNVYSQNTGVSLPNLPINTISDLIKTTNLSSSITNHQQIILPANNPNSAQALLSETNRLSPSNSPIFQKKQKNNNQNFQQQHIELMSKHKKQNSENSQSKSNNRKLSDNLIVLKQSYQYKSKNQVDQLIDKKVDKELTKLYQEEIDINLGNVSLADQIIEEKELWKINDCQGSQSQSLLNKLACDVPSEQKGLIKTTIQSTINNTSPNLTATPKTFIQNDQKQQDYHNILKERIKYTIRCRTVFLKLYSQVSRMQNKILNLDNYLKGERKINYTRADIFLSQQIYSILSQYRFDIETRKIKILFQNLCNSASIHQDPEMLSNIFQNIIQNAIDYNQQLDGYIEIKIEDARENSNTDKIMNSNQIKITFKNSIPLIDEQKVEQHNHNFQKQIKGIYFGMERESIQLSQIRYDKYFFGLRIAQKNVRCIGPLNKIDIHFTTNSCEVSLIIYQDINIINFKK